MADIEVSASGLEVITVMFLTYKMLADSTILKLKEGSEVVVIVFLSTGFIIITGLQEDHTELHALITPISLTMLHDQFSYT